MARFIPPYDGDVSTWHRVLGRNKRSIALDLKQPAAVEVVKWLVTVGGYDIVLEQFRPGVMDRLGIGYEVLSGWNPGLIYCAVTGYGQTGPYRSRAGHDNNYLALSGLMSHSGRRDEGPPPLGAQITDIGGVAFGAVAGILTAVIQRQQTGEGQLVDISMLDMSIFWQVHVIISGYLLAGEAPQPEGWALNRGSFYDTYETQDGRYLSVGSLEPKFWQGFCQAIGRPDLMEKGVSRDTAVQQTLKQEIRAAIAQKTLAEWQAIFADLDVCVEPVLTVPEMTDHPQVQARQMMVDVPKGEGETQKQVGSPFRFSGTEAKYWRVGGDVGEDTAVVLAEIGYGVGEIGRLRTTGLSG